MNSANQRSKAFTGGSPWSDVGSRATPGKPPRSPASPYRYHEGLSFDSSATNTNRKRSVQRSKKNPKTLDSSQDDSPKPPSDEQPSASTTPKQANHQEKELEKTESSNAPISSTPSVNSIATIGNESPLKASSAAFVPSKATLANLTSPPSTAASSSKSIKVPISNASNGTSKKQKVRARHPEGAELKKMVSVLLKVVDKAPKAGSKSSAKKKIFALYPFVGSTPSRRSPFKGTRKSPGSDASPRRFPRRSRPA